MINMLKLNDVFKLKGTEYIVIDEIEYDNKSYVFVNRLNEKREPSKTFIVYKNLDKGIVEEKNPEKLKNVLEIFSKNMNEKLVAVNRYYLKDEI